MPAFLCMRPPLFSILASATKRNLQQMAQGLAGSVAALASVIGWLVGRLLYSVLDPRVFVISATLTLLVFMLGFAIPVRSKYSCGFPMVIFQQPTQAFFTAD